MDSLHFVTFITCCVANATNSSDTVSKLHTTLTLARQTDLQWSSGRRWRHVVRWHDPEHTLLCQLQTLPSVLQPTDQSASLDWNIISSKTQLGCNSVRLTFYVCSAAWFDNMHVSHTVVSDHFPLFCHGSQLQRFLLHCHCSIFPLEHKFTTCYNRHECQKQDNNIKLYHPFFMLNVVFVTTLPIYLESVPNLNKKPSCR